MIVPKLEQEQKAVPMTYSLELVKTTIRLLDEARTFAKNHPDVYDAETIKDLDARIKKWGLRLTELTCQS